MLNGPRYLIALFEKKKNKQMGPTRHTWSVKKKRGRKEAQLDISEGKRRFSHREGTLEIKIWTEHFRPDNCRFFYAWHSARSLAWGYSNKQEELGVVMSHTAEDCTSAGDNDVSCRRGPRPCPFASLRSHWQAKCSGFYSSSEEEPKKQKNNISGAVGDNRTHLRLHLTRVKKESGWNKIKV